MSDRRHRSKAALGYAADLVLPLAITSINGVANESKRGVDRVADAGFVRLAAKNAEARSIYADHSFWIANTDLRSKYSFAFVMLLFSISDTGVRGTTPVVTVPAN